mgnify:CR=1 FL=1
MENINSRIKNLRKESGLNQKEFAKKIGLTQTGVSHIEQNGHNVSDSTIKAICYEFKINEQWLRNGIEPMLVQPDTFSLDAFVKEQGMSDLELRILKRYFALDAKTRQDALAYFLGDLESEKMERNSATMLREEFEECPRNPESMDQACTRENHKAI